MLEDITVGQYYPGNSILHRMDPRAKVISALVYMVSLFSINTPVGYAIVVGAGLAAAALARIPAGYFWRGFKPVFFLALITLLLNMLVTPGTVLVALGPLHVTDRGLVLGAFMSTRLLLLVLVASLVTLTTTPVDLTEGLERLLSPARVIGVPAHEIAMMMSIALRFIPTLLEEAEKIIKAQKARGAPFEGGNLIARVKNIIPLLVPLFLSSLRRADELATAMEARCYRGGEGRTRMKELHLKPGDALAMAASLSLVVVAIVSRR